MANINATQEEERAKKIQLLKKQHKELQVWIHNNIANENWESKVREYNALSSQILAMEGKTKYIIIHHQN